MVYCTLCASSINDELRMGKFHTLNNLHVHERCLYLSSNLTQRFRSKCAILYFDINDIKAEAERVKKLTCCYCSKKHANISCCNTSCCRTFHTKCGNLHGALNQFQGRFKSFCNRHVVSFKDRPNPSEKCGICFDDLIGKEKKFSCTSHMHGKCCKNGWYHKDCLQKYANSSGYFFKCPLCNDTTKFLSVVQWGVSVPQSDASWENTNMYEDQMMLDTTCSARLCVNPKGRESDNPPLLYCRCCGSNPMHLNCTQLKYDEYQCDTCLSVTKVATNEDDEDDENDDLDPVEKLSAIETAKWQRAAQICGNTSVTISVSNSKNDRYKSCSDSDSDTDIDWDELRAICKYTKNTDSKELAAAKQETPSKTTQRYSLRNRNYPKIDEVTLSKKEEPPSEIETEMENEKTDQKEEKQPIASVQTPNQIHKHSFIASRTRANSKN